MSPMKSPPILLKSTPEHPLFDAVDTVIYLDIVLIERELFTYYCDQ